MKKLSKWYLIGFMWISLGVLLELPWLVAVDRFGADVFRLDVAQEVSEGIFAMSRIGSIGFLAVMSLAISGLLLYHRELKKFLWFGFSMAMAGGLAPLIMKLAFRRPRPTDGLMTRSGYSFPSGHTMGTLALYGLIIILASDYVRKTWMRNVVIAVSTLIILVISWTRIHLGVHFLSDIMGSHLLGLSLLMTLAELRKLKIIPHLLNVRAQGCYLAEKEM